MWKIFVAFIAFALLALFVIMKGGDKVDMQGEAAGHNPEASASAQVAASAPAASVPAASAPVVTTAATPAASEAAPAASK
jgi:hypothetical protein